MLVGYIHTTIQYLTGMKRMNNQRNGIGPHDQLPDGTKVRVGNKLGQVVSSKVVDAIPRGSIVVHTIEFTHRIVRIPRPRMMRMQKPQTYSVNYSNIQIMESDT
jgi:hypothetical protein